MRPKTLRGEQYYPVHPDLDVDRSIKSTTGLAYRWSGAAEHRLRDLSEEGLSWADTMYFVKAAKYLVCPPSVIAYEAMRVGTPVILHKEVEGHDLIVDALVKKGYATTVEGWKESGPPPAHRESPIIDGLGAQRVLQEFIDRIA